MSRTTDQRSATEMHGVAASANASDDCWFALANAAEIVSPALLVYPDRIRENARRMIDIAGGTLRLRPHVKTHKMPDVVRIQQDAGIDKYKCATIAEAEMLARCEATDVLLAYQLVGPHAARFARLIAEYPRTRFLTIADDAGAIRHLAGALTQAGQTAEVLLDVDVGMHRTGVVPGPDATALYRLIGDLDGLAPGGLHVYDGHLRDREVAVRIEKVDAAFAPVEALRDELVEAGLDVPRVVAGGTPTFPAHARRAGVECSPGTCLLWDTGYSGKLPDLKFLYAAVLLTRVISKAGRNRLCLDLGTKAIAADPPLPRVTLFDVPDAKTIVHNEEHLAIETRFADRYAVGDVLYGIPYHICPTCALHREAIVVTKGRADKNWPIVARDRILSI